MPPAAAGLVSAALSKIISPIFEMPSHGTSFSPIWIVIRAFPPPPTLRRPICSTFPISIASLSYADMPTRDCIGKKLSLVIVVVGDGAAVVVPIESVGGGGGGGGGGEEEGLSFSSTLE